MEFLSYEDLLTSQEFCYMEFIKQQCLVKHHLHVNIPTIFDPRVQCTVKPNTIFDAINQNTSTLAIVTPCTWYGPPQSQVVMCYVNISIMPILQYVLHNVSNDEPFYYQLMHIMLKNTELSKHSKINKNAPTCFGLHRNHLQGAKVSAWLKITHLVNSICVKDVQMCRYC